MLGPVPTPCLVSPTVAFDKPLKRGAAFFMPCDANSDSQVSRGTATVRPGQPSRSAKVAAISSGVPRCGPSNSTTRRRAPIVMRLRALGTNRQMAKNGYFTYISPRRTRTVRAPEILRQSRSA